MAERGRWLAPTYLFACLLLGGSAQGIWQNMILQLAGLAILAFAAAKGPSEALSRPAWQLLALAMAAIGIVMAQLIPLPASFLGGSGVRSSISGGLSAMISVAPYDALAALLAAIPFLAMLSAVLVLKAYRPSWLALALLGGTLAGVVLGSVQVAGGRASAWYLYPETNVGVGVGFFANANHMATLLLIALPFLAAAAVAARSLEMQRYSALLSVAAGAALVVVVGVAINGSLAGYGLLLPVLAGSALILLPRVSRLRTWLSIAAAVLLLIGIAALSSSSIGSARFGQDASTSVQSRHDILVTSAKAIRDFLPLGSGLGSFSKVYRLYESPDLVNSTYVVHAHNDYVELALELGIAGILLLLVFLAWWIAAVRDVWRTSEAGPFARAASIASLAILAHSLVDFPLRTAAISACFAMSLALLADRRAILRRDEGDLRPTRHFVFR